jgi:twitching motility protein PilT
MDQQFEQILRLAYEQKASDIHLTVGLPPMLRVNGGLRPFNQIILRAEDNERMLESVVTPEQWNNLKEKGEIDFSFGLKGVTRFRVNAYHQRSCIAIALRLIPTRVPSLEELYMPEIVGKIVAKAQGLILITGPTGSGKSTTLAAMINHINMNMKRHIITLEDPIEYLHTHHLSIINQREVGFDTQSFSNVLRASLRQDPDVILLGEMRDLDTISTAITASETGHLVLATLHTTDTPSTIDRIVDVFPPNQQEQVRIQLASVLVGVISQRLFPTLDGTGRRVATEILINNAATANLIRNEKAHQITNVLQTSASQGMHTLDMSMSELVKKNIISKEVIEPYLKEVNS